jgi:hypothetical protein
MYTKKLFFTLASCLLLCSNTHAQDKKEDLVQLACAGNQSALAAIETYYSKCNLTCESPEGIGKKNTEYWRNSALIRLREPHAITTLDVKIEKGKLYSVQICTFPESLNNLGDWEFELLLKKPVLPSAWWCLKNIKPGRHRPWKYLVFPPFCPALFPPWSSFWMLESSR